MKSLHVDILFVLTFLCVGVNNFVTKNTVGYFIGIILFGVFIVVLILSRSFEFKYKLYILSLLILIVQAVYKITQVIAR